jgi:hypothetical protein
MPPLNFYQNEASLLSANVTSNSEGLFVCWIHQQFACYVQDNCTSSEPMASNQQIPRELKSHTRMAADRHIGANNLTQWLCTNDSIFDPKSHIQWFRKEAFLLRNQSET